MNATEQFWARPRTLLRWMCTQWCNFACYYCDQDHSRKQIYKGGEGHWADAATLEQWKAAFDAQFANHQLTVTITGGEPFLEKQMPKLLEHLNAQPYVAALHVDTNLSAPLPEPLAKLDLTCSYHPTETDKFWAKLSRAIADGHIVTTVNYVVDKHRISTIPYVIEASPVPVNILPDFNAHFTEEQLAVLRRYISPTDFANRTGAATFGRPCLFPSIAYEMRPDGRLRVGCHPELAGNIFDTLPERPAGYTACPDANCFCIEKYSFLHDVNTGPVPQRQFAGRIPLI